MGRTTAGKPSSGPAHLHPIHPSVRRCALTLSPRRRCTARHCIFALHLGRHGGLARRRGNTAPPPLLFLGPPARPRVCLRGACGRSSVCPLCLVPSPPRTATREGGLARILRKRRGREGGLLQCSLKRDGGPWTAVALRYTSTLHRSSAGRGTSRAGGGRTEWSDAAIKPIQVTYPAFEMKR